MDSPTRGTLQHGHYVIYRDKMLGNGTFGPVYFGVDKGKERQVAVKHITHASVDVSQREVNALSKLTEHDNIIRVYDSFLLAGSRWIIMQYCQGPTLDNYMERKQPNENTRMEIIQQHIEAMHYMHSSEPPTAKGDLKPSHIIIVHGHQLKICHLGLAKYIDKKEVIRAGSIAGTPSYIPPEIYKLLRCSPFKSDVYASGLLLLGVSTFTPGQPFGHLFRQVEGKSIGQQMLLPGQQSILQDKLDTLEFPSEHTTMLISLIRQMVSFNPDDRPDFKEVFHDFMDIMRRGGSESSHSSEDEDDRPCADRVVSRWQDKLSLKALLGVAILLLAVIAAYAIPRCSNGLCQHGSTCEDAVFGFTCICPVGYTGVYCETDIEECVSAPCMNGATCRDGVAQYTCDCTHGYTGTHCETALPPSFKPLTHQTLQIKASFITGLSDNGEILLADESHLYLFKHDGKEYDEMWEKMIPNGLRKYANKLVTGTGKILLQDSLLDADTVHFTLDLHQQRVFWRPGILLDSAHNGYIMYSRGTYDEQDWYIDVWKTGTRPAMTLRSPHAWRGALSACTVGDKFAVTDPFSLDLFSMDGDHILHRYLTYKPLGTTAITSCGSHHVIISENRSPPVLHVHSLDGKEVARIDHHHLGLGDIYVYGLRCSTDGILYMVTGSGYCIKTLHAFQVIYDNT